jgi:pyrroloquinoline quinone biosynthesis protein E
MAVNVTRLRKIISKMRHPARVVNYLGGHAACRLKLIRVPFLPPRIDLEPNNTCNLKCRHCQVTHWSKKPVYLDEKGFARVLDQLPHLVSVKLQGMGEPFLNKKLFAMLREGDKRGIAMQVISNGTLLNEAAIEKMLNLKNFHVCFSIDGATAKVHEKMRPGSNLQRILTGIRALTSRRGASARPVITATTVLTAENVHEIPEIVKLADSLGIDTLVIQTALTVWGKDDVAGYNESIRVSTQNGEVAKILQEAQALAKDLRLEVKVSHDDYYSRKNKCPWPWTRAFIAANGDVVPCCVIADSDVIKMGNIYEQSFAEIWNSPKYRELRRRIKEHRLYDFCKNCYHD